MTLRSLTLAFALITAPVAAQDLTLRLPLDCELGETCFIQQYVDLDPGPGTRDFTGGPLTYDGHKGTDFRVADLEAMERTVPVLAPAPGRIIGTRDEMADRIAVSRAEVAGRECGNGVSIDHGGGWVTQLCHLALGSVRVRQGDTVEAGQPIGAIGLSGATQFPHVHLSVRKDGEVVDPFQENLWQEAPTYEPGGFLSAGFLDRLPDFSEIKDGTADASDLPVNAPALVVWGALFGGQAGDIVDMRIIGPNGQEVHTSQVVLERTQAQLFRASGRKLRAPRWTGGSYRGEVTLTRNGTVIDRIETQVELN